MGAIELAAIGEELLGTIWQRPLVHLLAINHRTIQRCANGSAIMPQAIAARILTLRDTVRRLRNESANDRARLAAQRAAAEPNGSDPMQLARLLYRLRKSE